MKKKRKLKKQPIIILGAIIIFIIIIFSIIKTINYHNTYNYKLEKLGYKQSEVKYIIKNLKDTSIDYL